MYIVELDKTNNVLSKTPATEYDVSNGCTLNEGVQELQFWRDENGNNRQTIAYRCLNGQQTTTWYKSKNSNRQIGDRPKVQKTYRLDADLIDALTSKAETEGITQTEILEKAIAQYLA